MDNTTAMSTDQVHFELYVRKRANEPWRLAAASENRAQIVEGGEAQLASGSVAAIKVTKETLDPESREFRSVTILAKGAVDQVKSKPKLIVDDAPNCGTPADLYTLHAREKIGRLLEVWLANNRITVWELLHRPDMAELLDSGHDLRGAIQKIAVAEHQSRGIDVHKTMRELESVVERAIQRLVSDGRAGVFPLITPETFADVCAAAPDHVDRTYSLGGGVAAYLAPASDWSQKLQRLLDLADAAPSEPKARDLALGLIETPLAEIIGSRLGLSEILGRDLDLGGQLGAWVRIALGPGVRRLGAFQAQADSLLPPLEAMPLRLANTLASNGLRLARSALVKRVFSELQGPKRLRPAHPEGEIAILRTLAVMLTALIEDGADKATMREAFLYRSRGLVAAGFVEPYLESFDTALAKINAMIRLAENVTGAANKREAAKWIASLLSSLKFEKELRSGRLSPTSRLTLLADLQKRLREAELASEDQTWCGVKLGDLGAQLEAESDLIHLLARANIPRTQRVIHLLKLACGQTAPLGPIAGKAKDEALKLMRAAETRAEFAQAPDQFVAIKSLLVALGLAA